MKAAKEDRKLAFKERVEGWLVDPRLSKFLKLSTGVLDVFQKVGSAPKNPLTLISAAGSLVETAKGAFMANGSQVYGYIRALDLIDSGTDFGEVLKDSTALDSFHVENVAKDDWDDLCKITVDDETQIWLLKHNRWKGCRLYVKRGDEKSVERLVKAFFVAIGGIGIELTKTGTSGDVTMRSIPTLYNDHDLEEILHTANAIHECRRAGKSPAFIFYGNAGTGKTTHACSVAQLMGLTVIIIGPQALSSLSGKTLFEIITSLRPGMLVLDDVDKASDVTVFYTALNHLRSELPWMTVIATTNDFKPLKDAFLRPGRGGEIKMFPPPTLEQKVKILKENGIPDAIDCRVIADLIPEDATHDWVRSIGEKIACRANCSQAQAEQITAEICRNFKIVNDLKVDLVIPPVEARQ